MARRKRSLTPVLVGGIISALTLFSLGLASSYISNQPVEKYFNINKQKDSITYTPKETIPMYVQKETKTYMIVDEDETHYKIVDPDDIITIRKP